MSPESAFLLDVVQSWTCAAIGVILLALVAPAMLALAAAAVPLAMSRRDWRALPPMLIATVLATASGAWSIALIRPPLPALDFWVGLVLRLGLVVFTLTFLLVLRVAIRRIREEREALQSVSALPLADIADHEIASAPSKRERLSGIDAEYWIAEWMRHLGAEEAIVTPARRDGGVDVRSDHYVAQVKHRPHDFVSVDQVRALAGVAANEGRAALFFASSHYSRDAIAFAGSSGVALFIFRPAEARLIGANAMAFKLRGEGLRGRAADSPRPTAPSRLGGEVLA